MQVISSLLTLGIGYHRGNFELFTPTLGFADEDGRAA